MDAHGKVRTLERQREEMLEGVRALERERDGQRQRDARVGGR
jgi:hypothetical protein